MWFTSSTLLLTLCFLFSGLIFAEEPKTHSLTSKTNPIYCLKDAITAKDLQTHVEFLSSESLEGRLTGSIGEQRATQYVAEIFHCLGLEPAGDKGTFFQEFNFTSGVSFGKNNSLLITDQKGKTKAPLFDKEWRPLSFSDTISFESTELIFAGYGITAPALGKLQPYDSYKDINVNGKWVAVFRYTPEQIATEQRRQLSQYSSPRYKVFTAKNHGAKGIIFVSGPNSKVKHELIPLSFDASLSGSGIVAVSVKDKILDDLLKNSDSKFNSLQKLQDQLDLGKPDPSPVVAHIKISGQINMKLIKKRGRNVLAKLKVGGTPQIRTLVIGAHADHLGRGEQSSSRAGENEKGLIHYGADDNASGVASVMEAAALLTHMKANGALHGDKDILFAVWSGEELGLLGSSHFVKKFMEKTKNKSLRPGLEANINLDMVGRLRKNLVLQALGSSFIWPKLIAQVSVKHPIHLITQNDPYLPTDSTSFYLHGVPTLNLFTGSHDEYHTTRDKPKTLNYEGMKNISEFLVDLILALEAQPQSIAYQQVPKTHNVSGRGFRVYFGTIPDYASSDVSGVKLSGVTKGSPAEHAGLIPGDVIIKLAGKRVHDIYDYTFVLNALHVNESVPLVIRRGQKKVSMTIVARARD